MTFLLIAAAGYLIGSIPSGVLICRLFGKDPRQVGSGRTGGTNVYRTAGLFAAVITVALDVAKGAVGAWLGFTLAGAHVGWAATDATRTMSGADAAWLGASVGALAAIVGHNYSVFAGFRGGAGSSPNLGAILVLDPLLGLVGFAVSFVVLFGLRVASLASLTLAAIVAAGGLWQIAAHLAPRPFAVYCLGQLLLITWALRPNIARLMAGEERRITFGKPHDEPAEAGAGRAATHEHPAPARSSPVDKPAEP